ncbi:LysR substrate-binding domain-containing protein [Niveispirillum irakense]|uniref:LysR substrate-binding domain-containing protein n=1 Tax=Niveispirillum irakense TaxID=34011 RepID=UPI00040B37F3|nr:LysR substrate-binding domain-containing protein [Niveispirillum irakense]
MFARRLIPSTSALVAFEAAARLGSFTAAAHELSLTQGAVSRQVAQLEGQLGVILFERVRQRVSLTPAGRFLAEQARDTLARLAQATAQTIAFGTGGGTLDLAILPTFGARWLIPRMGGFFARHRDISVNFSTRVRPFDLRAEGIDAAIMTAPPADAGLVSHRFMGEELLPVAAPALVRDIGLAAPVDLRRTTLLQQETRAASWDHWFAVQGLMRGNDQPVLVFEQFLLVIRAAVAGLGCALVPGILIRDEIASGELVLLPGGGMQGQGGYHLVYPRDRDHYGPLVAFRDWLFAEAALPAGN